MGIEEKINLNQIKDISEGDTEFEEEIIGMYLADTNDRLAALDSCLKEQNWQKLKTEAHTLKGSSGNIGVMATFDLCKQLERASLDHDLEEANKLFMEIVSTTKEVKQFFNSYLETL